jgi:hypothetical protein
MKVIPPGMEFKHISINDADVDGELDIHDDGVASPNPPAIWSEVLTFILTSIVFLSKYLNWEFAFLKFQLE